MSWTEIDILKEQVRWLMSLLSEFKPNVYLDLFLGELLIDLLNFWNIITTYLNQYELAAVKYLIAPFGLMGLSFQMAIMHDCLSIITIHINLVYLIFAYTHKKCLEILLNCLRMFSGKKYNYLTQKLDDNEYNFEEFF